MFSHLLVDFLYSILEKILYKSPSSSLYSMNLSLIRSHYVALSGPKLDMEVRLALNSACLWLVRAGTKVGCGICHQTQTQFTLSFADKNLTEQVWPWICGLYHPRVRIAGVYLIFFFFRNIIFRLGLLIYAHHLSTQEAETRELQVQCQPGLHTSKA